MAKQIKFPGDADFPPPKRHKKIDDILDMLFQCLPAPSGEVIQGRLAEKGIDINYAYLMVVISYLRKHCDEYNWTIPHVKAGAPSGEDKFFHILLEEDGTFFSDPQFQGHLTDGSASMLTRLQTESENQASMLRAASEAEHGSRFLKQVFSDMGEECRAMSKKCGRILRIMKAGNDE
jgi:hypothetical protein